MDTHTRDNPHAQPLNSPRRSANKPAPKTSDDKVRVIHPEGHRRPAPFFVTRCEARLNDAFFPSNGLSVAVGQLIRQNGLQKLWDSVLLRCEEESDGTLAIRVIIANPD